MPKKCPRPNQQARRELTTENGRAPRNEVESRFLRLWQANQLQPGITKADQNPPKPKRKDDFYRPQERRGGSWCGESGQL